MKSRNRKVKKTKKRYLPPHYVKVQKPVKPTSRKIILLVGEVLLMILIAAVLLWLLGRHLNQGSNHSHAK